jgi:hypothetical protein
MLWRDPRWAGLHMWGYFLISLAVGPVIFTRAGGAPPGLASHVLGAVASAFFAWRVTRGGRVSRTLLILVAECAFVVTASAIASRFGPLIFGLLAAYAVQVALLLSPSVYRRTRAPGWAEPAGWARLRPPLALLLLGILAGLVFTLQGLNTISTPQLGCDHGDAGRLPVVVCMTVARGAPLHWLTAYHGAPVVNWAAMAKDWAQDAVISASVLYGSWLVTRARKEPADGRVLGAAIAGSALAGLTLTVVTGGIPLTWLTVSDYDQYAPASSVSALLADTALWTLAVLGGCLAVRKLVPRLSRPPRGRS